MLVLVTGSSGFIGRATCAALWDAGHSVRMFDREGPADVVGDLTDGDACARALDDVDAVCHLAARVGLGVDPADIVGYEHDNGLGTATLLRALHGSGFEGRVALASSMVVYGEGRYRCWRHGPVACGPRAGADLAAGRFEPPCPHPGCGEAVGWVPVTEDAPTDPRNVYAATKLHQEHLCRSWARETGARLVSLRYHNVYGPGLPLGTPYAGVAALFATEAAAGRPPVVFEDGGQMRDFVHVDDVARANVAAVTAPGNIDGAYNVASGQPRSVLDVATGIAAAAGAPPPVVTGQFRLGDVRHIVASPDRAAAALGFTAAVPFDQGMAELAASLRAPATARP